MDQEEWMRLFWAYKRGEIALTAVPPKPLRWDEVWPSDTAVEPTNYEIFALINGEWVSDPRDDNWQTDRDVSAYYDKLWLNELGIRS